VTVTAVPPTALAYALNPAPYTRGVAIAANAPANGGGAIASYSVAPALPAGLTLNPGTGVLTGTPTALAPASVYTVTGTNTGGSTSAALTLSVVDAAPAITFGQASYRFTTGTPLTALIPANSGGPVVTWSISPALPAGLTFSAADGSLSGTPGAVAAAQVYTITATNSGGASSVLLTLTVAPPGPVLTAQPHSQILALGASAAFSVSATGTGTLTYQWYRDGAALPGATGPAYTLGAVGLGDDGARFTVTVADAFGGSTLSAAAQLSLFQDLAAWLGSHPAIAAAIQWQWRAHSASVYAPPDDTDKLSWSSWTPQQQADLNQAYLDACAWLSQGAPQVTMVPGGPGLTDQPVNRHPSVNTDASPILEWLDAAYFWKLYTSHVGFSLMVEISRQVPWTVTDYPAAHLRYLYDSATMGWLLPNGFVGMGTYESAGLPTLRADTRPRTSFADPRWTYPWLQQAGIPGGTRLATIGGMLDWMRHDLYHFIGSDTFGNDFAIWKYRGYSPLSQIVLGTVDANNPSLGVQHFTAGCHGSVGFLHATLRVLNIPVQPIWICGHELAWFMTEDLYLDHGDDPYNQNVVKSSTPSLNLLIPASVYQSLFTADLTVNILDNANPVWHNVGFTAANFH